MRFVIVLNKRTWWWWWSCEVIKDVILTGVQALDDGGGVDEVSTAESTQQVFVDVVDATSSSSGHLLARHVTRRASRLIAEGGGGWLHQSHTGHTRLTAVGPPYIQHQTKHCRLTSCFWQRRIYYGEKRGVRVPRNWKWGDANIFIQLDLLQYR